ncbi:AP-3 complex subunit delta-1-like isoform X4 [Clavelina lepadiformis]|uniref:AP-3 complex subunit delta-1-like isoform X4 n=1 Tax=Clavelina lepadiformis TaxID=159417 RepID=UPI0040411FD5
MALKNVKRSIDRIFDKNLQDLVRGIRNHKENEVNYISQCIDEIKVELKQENVAVKANAVNKLIYLQMLGYDISWAAFNIIEVMSSPKFTFKRIGYLAASQCFHSDTDVLMLTTNMIRKDLGSQNNFDAGIAINGLSCFMTTDLARDLANDILALMSSIRPYTRKRAVLISYKIFLCYPEALRPAFPRLKEKLEDPDSGVQSAAVNVICELARKNPKNYLSLAPIFFKLMTSSTNNWVLIKIIKLFGALTPLEPRLGKKLIEPLTNLIHNTSAMSLLYECINTVIQGMQSHGSSIQGSQNLMKLCVQKLRILIEDSDQNLKYLGLLAMSRILKTHPKAVQSHKDLILQCLDDKDESIRLRALDLLFGMVSKKNLMEIIKKLMIHVEKTEGTQYRDELLSKIIEICSQNNYQYITNFEWYITVLVELTRMDGASRHGSLISSQLLDVAIRVKTIREFAANQMAAMLENAHAISGQLRRNGMQEVLFAAAYICGEFAELIEKPDSLIHAMLRPRVMTLPANIQCVYLQNIMKVFAIALIQAEEEEDNERALNLTRVLLEKLSLFLQSSYIEVQERASSTLSILKYIEKLQVKESLVAEEFSILFKGELNPVAPKAQRKVPVPEGLDLDAWINDPPSSSEDEQPEEEFPKKIYDELYSPTREKRKEMSPEEIKKRKEERLQEQASNPHYLMNKAADGYQKLDAEVDPGLAGELNISVPLHVPGLPSSERYLRMEQDRQRRAQAEKTVKKRHKKRGKKKFVHVSEDEEEDIAPTHAVDIVQEEMPEGAAKTDSENETTKDDPYRALDMDLDSPLTPSETLPRPRHHEVRSKPDEEKVVKEKKQKKKHKKKEVKKHKKKSRKAPTESLLVEEPANEQVSEVTQNTPDTIEKKENKAEAKDDLSFWLSNSDAVSAPEAAKKVEGPEKVVQVNGIEEDEDDHEVAPAKEKKKHKKKKDKKETKKHKKKHHNVNDTVEMEASSNLQLSSYKLLGENKEIKLEFETRSSSREEKKIVVSCLFENLTENHIKNIEFNILDTLNTRLVRTGGENSHDAVPIPFSLPALSRNECQLQLTASSVTMPQRMRGTVTYMVQDQEHTKQEKLDFKLHLPCSAYLVTTPFSSVFLFSFSNHFTKLLTSGDVPDKASVKVDSKGIPLDHVLQKLCFFLKLSVVEQVGDSASLYSSSIQHHHICLLVKAAANGFISVDGKSNNASLLSNIMDQAKEIVQG